MAGGFGGTTTKGRRFPAEPLTTEEVRGLLAACGRGACGARERALIAMLYRGGLRINEALMLEAKDVDVRTGVVRVLYAKGGKQRVVGVDEEAIAFVELWLERRERLGLGRGGALFCTLAGARLSRVQVAQRLKKLGEKAGIEKRVHPHGLRHSSSLAMMRAGIAVPLIQRALGHSSLATTAIYLNHIAPEDVTSAMRGMAW